MADSRFSSAKQPPFVLAPSLTYEEYSVVRLEHSWTSGTDKIHRKQDTIFCPDPSDQERLVRTIVEFIDLASPSRLNIKDEHLYAKFREVLGGDLRAQWTRIDSNIADADKTTANFPGHARKFLRKYLPNNSTTLLDEYLRTVKKPYSMNCYTLQSRLGLINTLSTYLPGSSGTAIFPDDNALKLGFYRLMLNDWQLNFDAAGHQIDSNTYTIDMLVDYMEQQRLHYNARRNDPQPSRRGNYTPGNYNRSPPRPTSYNNQNNSSGNYRPQRTPRYSPYPVSANRNSTPPVRTATPGRGNNTTRSPYPLRSTTGGRGNPGRGNQTRAGTGRGSNVRRNLQFFQHTRSHDHYHVHNGYNQHENIDDQYYADDQQTHEQMDYDQQDHYHDYDTTTRHHRNHYHSLESNDHAYTDHNNHEDHYYVADDYQYDQDDWVQDY